MRKIEHINGYIYIRWEWGDPEFARIKAVVKAAGANWNSSAKRWVILASRAVELVCRLKEEFGFEIGEGVEEAIASAPPPRRVEITKSGQFCMVFPYDPAVVRDVKEIPGRRWDASEKMWVLPPTVEAVRGLRCFLAEYDEFVLSEKARELMDKVEVEAEENISASRAKDAEIEVDGLGGELLPFQRAGVAYAARAKTCLIADEMGLGKTVQALATVQVLDAFPALVICPASLKLNWQREAEKWLPGRSVSVLDGRDGGECPNSDIVIVNYDILGNGKGGGWLDVLKGKGFQALIIDESHYIKNRKATRSKAVKELADGVPVRLALTGTPVLNRPIELAHQLDVLGRLRQFGGFWAFAKRYCNAYKGRYGWDLSGSSNLDELNDKLRATCYVRRTKAEVLSELPPKRRAIVPMEIDNRHEYERVERDVVSWLAERAAEDREFLASIEGLPEEERRRRKAERAWSTAERARRAQALVRIEALKQVAARGKLGAVCEWIENFLESGEKLVVFAHHREVVEELARRFDAPAVTGDTSVQARQAAVDRFQSDPACRIIVLNMQAGGVGLTLIAASNVAFVELGWTPAVHDQAEDRVHRIGQEGSVTAWYLLAESTIDERIWRLIERKRKVVGEATEGKVLEELIGELIGNSNCGG